MNLEEMVNNVKDRVCFDAIKKFDNSDKKKLIYTAFDGDYMNLLPYILDFVIVNRRIPVNPESALGYYVSTKRCYFAMKCGFLIQ